MMRILSSNLDFLNDETKERTIANITKEIAQAKATESIPVLKSIRFMSPDQKIELAEALVKMTCLKRTVTIDEFETVKEPILVAMITRQNGFQWVRKPKFEL
jgi:hypothetical protein